MVYRMISLFYSGGFWITNLWRKESNSYHQLQVCCSDSVTFRSKHWDLESTNNCVTHRVTQTFLWTGNTPQMEFSRLWYTPSCFLCLLLGLCIYSYHLASNYVHACWGPLEYESWWYCLVSKVLVKWLFFYYKLILKLSRTRLNHLSDLV